MMPRLPSVAGEHVGELALQVRAREDAIDEVRTIERSDELDGIAQAELRRDVAPDARRRGGGVGMEADAGQQRPQFPELPVLRAEVVPPLADAVRFVDGHEADLAGGEQVEEVLPPVGEKPFRRHVEQPEPSIPQAGDRRRPSDEEPGSCCSRPRRRRCRRACRPGPSSARSAGTRRARARRRTTAGAWKQSDLPPPVGSTTIESRPARIASIASRWSGRNEV